MRTKKLGKSELDLTVVGLGTWAIGGSWQYGWGHQEFEDSAAAIKEAQKAGINWIDTAPIYGCGHSEEVLGTVLKRIGWKPLIATKCGLLWNEKREKINCLRADSIKKECEDSLRRLGIETIDLYQMHWPEPDDQIEEAWDAMAQLVRQGKVRYLGVSNFSIEQMQRVSKIHPISSIQPPYNMIRRDIEKDITGYCKDNGIGIVAYSPMQLGLLTGKYDREKLKQLDPDDHRRQRPEFNEPAFSATVDMLKELEKIAVADNKSVAQLAISWVLHNEAVTAAIVGARRSGQIGETAAAGDYLLTDRQLEMIEELLQWRNNRIAEKMK
jgi:aryl-alcohol dehydrogenase-like predicted oxidoreductase